MLLISFKNHDSLKNQKNYILISKSNFLNKNSRNLDKFMNSVAKGYVTPPQKKPIKRCMPPRSNTLGNHIPSLNDLYTTTTLNSTFYLFLC